MAELFKPFSGSVRFEIQKLALGEPEWPATFAFTGSSIKASATSGVLPKRVMRNGPALVCWWGDGSKVVVKCSNEEFDAEKGLAMAVLRHLGVKRSWVKKAISGIEEQEG